MAHQKYLAVALLGFIVGLLLVEPTQATGRGLLGEWCAVWWSNC